MTDTFHKPTKKWRELVKSAKTSASRI